MKNFKNFELNTTQLLNVIGGAKPSFAGGKGSPDFAGIKGKPDFADGKRPAWAGKPVVEDAIEDVIDVISTEDTNPGLIADEI